MNRAQIELLALADEIDTKLECVDSFDTLRIFLDSSLEPLYDKLYSNRLDVESYMLKAYIESLYASLELITVKLGHVDVRPNNWEGIALHRFKDTMKLALLVTEYYLTTYSQPKN